MHLDSEFEYLIRQIINLEVDISIFPTIWAVLSIIIKDAAIEDEYKQDIQCIFDRVCRNNTKADLN